MKVYVVLEHARFGESTGNGYYINIKDAKLHGVYLTRRAASTAALRVSCHANGPHGYLSILKKTVEGLDELGFTGVAKSRKLFVSKYS